MEISLKCLRFRVAIGSPSKPWKKCRHWNTYKTRLTFNSFTYVSCTLWELWVLEIVTTATGIARDSFSLPPFSAAAIAIVAVAVILVYDLFRLWGIRSGLVLRMDHGFCVCRWWWLGFLLCHFLCLGSLVYQFHQYFIVCSKRNNANKGLKKTTRDGISIDDRSNTKQFLAEILLKKMLSVHPRMRHTGVRARRTPQGSRTRQECEKRRWRSGPIQRAIYNFSFSWHEIFIPIYKK